MKIKIQIDFEKGVWNTPLTVVQTYAITILILYTEGDTSVFSSWRTNTKFRAIDVNKELMTSHF